MKPRFANASKKLNVNEEPEETQRTSAAKEDQLLMRVLKDNSSRDLQKIKVLLRQDFLLSELGWIGYMGLVG